MSNKIALSDVMFHYREMPILTAKTTGNRPRHSPVRPCSTQDFDGTFAGMAAGGRHLTIGIATAEGAG